MYIDEDKLDQEHKDVANIIANLMCRIKSAGIGIRIFYRTYHGAELKMYLATNSMEIIHCLLYTSQVKASDSGKPDYHQ